MARTLAALALAVVWLPAVPAHAGRAARVSVTVTPAPHAGLPVTISGRVTGRVPTRLSARLQLRSRGRWTWARVAPAPVRRRAFTLRWTLAPTGMPARVRVVVVRGRKPVAVSSSRKLTLAATRGATSDADCVTKSTLLSVGGDQDWSAERDLIVYSKPGNDGANQLHVIRPDGSGDTDISSRAVAAGVRADRHKTVPTWEPGGRWIVAQVETADWYPGVDERDVWLRERAINGVASSLWAVSPTGTRWVRLTTEAWPWSYGAMAAHFSRDGRQIVFSRLVEPAGFVPWGRYRLILADFRLAPDGTPSLANQRDVTPPGHVFAEAHGFSPAGTDVLFASYGATDFANMDIWSLSLQTGATRRLTTSTLWDEHATYSPSGRRIVYFAGELGIAPMTGDLMSMNPDGSDKRRLTAFNQPGAPGATGEQTMVMRPTFSADGSRVAVTEQLTRDFPAHRRMSVVDLGSCG